MKKNQGGKAKNKTRWEGEGRKRECVGGSQIGVYQNLPGGGWRRGVGSDIIKKN